MNEAMNNQRLWYALLMGMMAEANRAHLDGDKERAAAIEAAGEQVRAAGNAIGWDTAAACKEVLTSIAEREASGL